MCVAIVGGPGVGKRTLVRQLGDLYHHGSYGEGEKGVWHPHVLEDIEAGRTAVGATQAARARVIFGAARPNPQKAKGADTPPAIHKELRKVLALGDGWNPDRV